MTVTVSHRDTCLPGFVTDHHNRPGECLVGVYVDAACRVHHVKTALYDEAAALLGHCDDAPEMAALSAAINECFKGTHMLKTFDSSLDSAHQSDDIDGHVQAWFLITWPAAEDAGDDDSNGAVAEFAPGVAEHGPRMVAQPSQQQQARAAAPSHSADASHRQRIAFGPARLYPAAKGATDTGCSSPPDGAELIGYNVPAGRFYAVAYRLTNGCVLVDTCTARGAYDARLRRIFVNLECAELYAGRLARLARYRRERAHYMAALGHIRAVERTYRISGRRKVAQRQLAVWRQSNCDVLEAFGAELPPVVDDVPAYAGLPADLRQLADWLA